ncbi:DUF4112 domain-containing protein [Novosphingobium flavum]|uniref:DUF4112 domain-containing protein n=1 Tax=Novosphingobium flavum TaxID=1778672 RepID=A0A7X1FRA2_9SPHN|nr:DUF4112 domain-containing protein [Novosphingobium flavum]MBC2665072.1 DUF4112 domain-containing protein [Novosphingobium flavum]
MNNPSARSLNQGLPLGSSPEAIRRRVEALEGLLERSITVPGIGRKVGLDALVGLIPVAGDALGALLGLYIVWEARLLGLPKWKIARMLANVAIDTAVGAVPVAGDLFDFAFRSNSMNLAILRRHLDRHHPETRIIEA